MNNMYKEKNVSRVCHINVHSIYVKVKKKEAKRNTTPVLAVKTLAFTRCTRENEYHRRSCS